MTFLWPRGGKYRVAESHEIALKRDEKFSQVIHIFFSSEKNVNHLRKIRLFQGLSYTLYYECDKDSFPDRMI